MTYDTDWRAVPGFTVDPDTGLPLLPPNYFWRIARSVVFAGSEIQLRKRVWPVFSRKINYTLFGDTQTVTPKSALSEAWYVLGYRLTSKQRAALLGNEYVAPASMLGDYPPKKLES